MARRTYQAGYVFQRGKTKSDRWDPNLPAYGRYWADVPGGQKRHGLLSLGICRTRTIAERACMEQLDQLGVNSTQRFIETTSNVTFKLQGELWLKSLANRKRNPIEQTTIDTRRYALDKWIYPFLEDHTLGEVNNHTMRELVEHMSKLSAASIRDYSNIVKAVIASAINENGDELFPRKWNEEYIDAPPVIKQHQPTVNREQAAAIYSASFGRGRLLCALLAGCGPLRIGEALGLEIGKHISDDHRTLYIRQKVKRGKVQPFLKTQAGERDIDLSTELAALLRESIGGRTSGFLFCTSSGRPWGQRNALRDFLYSAQRRAGLPEEGFNIFRRFRVTHLNKMDCPRELQHFWSGHAQEHISERYTKLLGDRAYRLEWAERVGLGFSLTGQPGQLIVMQRTG